VVHLQRRSLPGVDRRAAGGGHGARADGTDRGRATVPGSAGSVTTGAVARGQLLLGLPVALAAHRPGALGASPAPDGADKARQPGADARPGSRDEALRRGSEPNGSRLADATVA